MEEYSVLDIFSYVPKQEIDDHPVHPVLVHGQHPDPAVWRNLRPHHGRRRARHDDQAGEPVEDAQLRRLLQID